MKIAITGASGRIGNVLVRRLLEEGHELRVLVRRESKALAGLQIQQVNGDVSNPDALAELAQGCEVLFHAAALISIQGGMNGLVRRTNVDGTRNVLEISLQQGVRRVVYFSTFHVFDEFPPDVPLDETRPLVFKNRMAYTQSKAEALDLALHFSENTNLEIVALCPTSVLGPHDYEPSLSGQMLLDFYRRKIPMLVPGGVDWVDVRDVADAAVAAITQGRSGEAYILSGSYASVPELAGLIGKITGKPVPERLAPNWLLRAGLPFVKAYAGVTATRPLFTAEALDTLRKGARLVSSEKARRELGYSARSLEETIADAYEWFKQNGYL